MLAGMLAAHWPMTFLPMTADPRVTWIHHGAMLLGMAAGMAAAWAAYSATPTWLNIHAYWKAISFNRS